jgi:hypothetical protein
MERPPGCRACGFCIRPVIERAEPSAGLWGITAMLLVMSACCNVSNRFVSRIILVNIVFKWVGFHGVTPSGLYGARPTALTWPFVQFRTGASLIVTKRDSGPVAPSDAPPICFSK